MKPINAVKAVENEIKIRNEKQSKRDKLAILLAGVLEKEGFDIGSVEIGKEDSGPFKQEMSIRVVSSFRRENKDLKWPL